MGKPDKAELFFKLHELQTMSWGASKIGRVAQTIDPENGMLYSEFDTQIFSLTAIPIIGFWKLLPTFGGCVVTASKMNINENALNLEVEYTTAKPVEGLSGLGCVVRVLKSRHRRDRLTETHAGSGSGTSRSPSAPSGSCCPGIEACRPRAPWSRSTSTTTCASPRTRPGSTLCMLDPYNNTLPKDSVRNFQSLDGRADVVDADDVGVRDAGDAGAGRRRVSLRSVGLAREVAEEPFSRCADE